MVGAGSKLLERFFCPDFDLSAILTWTHPPPFHDCERCSKSSFYVPQPSYDACFISPRLPYAACYFSSGCMEPSPKYVGGISSSYSFAHASSDTHHLSHEFRSPAYFMINTPTTGTVWLDGSTNLVQWTIAKEDLSTFDIGMARFASPGLHMVAHNGECTPSWILVLLSSAVLFLGPICAHMLVIRTRCPYSVPSASTISSAGAHIDSWAPLLCFLLSTLPFNSI